VHEIIETYEDGADLQTLQAKLKCVTQYGSCVPKLKKLVVKHRKNIVLTK